MAETFPLRVHRPRTLANALRAYRLLVDGRELVTISSGEVVTLHVPHGSRQLVAKIDWVRSRPLDLAELAATPDPAVDCLTSHNPIDLIRAGFGLQSDHITFARHDPTRSAADDTRKLTVRLREAGLWVVGCAFAGVMLTRTVDNFDVSAALAEQIERGLGVLAGLAAVVGGALILRK
jgi:hypothetical protein